MIDWRQLLSAGDGYELRPGAAAGDVAAAEAALRAVFPADLRQLSLWPATVSRPSPAASRKISTT